MDVQQFERLLMRYERLAGRSARLQWMEKECDNLRRTLVTAQEGNRRRDRDMEAAEAKIDEWRAYAADLSNRINWKRQTDVPVLPKPLEFEMPF